MEIDSRLLKTVLAIVNTQGVTEVTVEMSPEGWSMYTMSYDHISMCQARIPSSMFEEYPVNERDEPRYFAFTPSKFLDVLKHHTGTIDLQIEQGRATVSSGSLRTTFALPEPAPTEKRIPDLQIPVTAFVSAEEVRKLISATDYDNQTTIKFDCSASMGVKSIDEAGFGSTLILTPEIYDHPDDPVRATYSMVNVDRFLRSLPKDIFVEMRLGADLPLMITVEEDSYSVVWMLAPIIEDDDA